MKTISVTFIVVACLVANIHCLPVESVTRQAAEQEPQQQIAVPLPALIRADLPLADSTNGDQTVVAVVPLSLLDVETTDEDLRDESAQRTARGLGGFGGLGKFGGLGLGFKGFGGFNSWGLGGLHGLGGLGGLGGGLHGFGFKPFKLFG